MRDFFFRKNLTAGSIHRIGISNVVPGRSDWLREVCTEMFNLSPLFVTHTLDGGITYNIEDPSELGPDLVSAAVAGQVKYGGPLILVDLGTATTFSVLSKDGTFQGVIICPGLKISVEAFQRRIPYLPEVRLETPLKLIGKNTIDSVQSGLLYGHVSMIEGLLRRLATELEIPHKVVVCGGLSPVVEKTLTNVDVVEPYLVLEGIRILCERNQ